MRRERNFLEKYKDQVIKWSKEGLNNAEIGRRIGCNGNIVGIFLKKYGVYSQQLKIHNAEKYKKEIVKRFNDGESLTALGKEFGFDAHTVSRYAKVWGLDTQKYAISYKHGLLKNHTQDIIKLYTKDKLNTCQIAKKYETSSSSIGLILRKNGIKLDHNGKVQKINLDYFSKIDTPNKAYILGFMYADGNVSQDLRTFRIALRWDDENILQRMKNDMEYNGKLKWRPPRKNGQAQIILAVNKTCMCEDLVRLGCMPRKSFKIRFPTEQQVPKYLRAHFCRGVWDGDGSLKYSSGNKCCSLTSNRYFLDDIIKVLPCEITNVYQFKNGLNPDDPDKCAHKLLIGRKYEAIKALAWMYGPCVYDQSLLVLERKLETFKKFLKV